MILQIILSALLLIGLGYSIGTHGKERKPEPENGLIALIATIIWFVFLWWEGFFDVFIK